MRDKGPKDLVTESDFASQEVIRETICKAFPDHDFLSEEDAAEIMVGDIGGPRVALPLKEDSAAEGIVDDGASGRGDIAGARPAELGGAAGYFRARWNGEAWPMPSSKRSS